MQLNLLPNPLTVAKLSSPLDWDPTLSDLASPLFAIIRDPHGLTLVCDSGCEPDLKSVESIQRDWRCLQVAGILEFSLLGILSALTATLAKAGVSVFVLSSFDTDYLLFKNSQLQQAIEALTRDGHDVAVLGNASDEIPS